MDGTHYEVKSSLVMAAAWRTASLVFNILLWPCSLACRIWELLDASAERQSQRFSKGNHFVG